ncbi:MAG TPA: glycosyltransferase [Dehalococcoidia bacterium]|nr:glycosyltransferase [Dehalococcoidia bacterium]
MAEIKNLVSVIIRTLNEEQYLEELLCAITVQELAELTVEIIIVDSGSTDSTLKIANKFDCQITHIRQSEFTFGRSLNIGCDSSQGEYLVFVSGHCVPCDVNWLSSLVGPLAEHKADYVYGRQVSRDTTKFSESELFRRCFPAESKIPQAGYFCNNANAAVTRNIWSKHKFNEELTGLEDLQLAKDIGGAGGRVGYVAVAPVFHIHNETWGRVKIRYEREAVALQQIEPRLHFNILDFFSFTVVGVWNDAAAALGKGQFFSEIRSIVMFRLMQYGGTYAGHREHLKVSEEMKREYFYPRISNVEMHDGKKKHSCTIADESK